MIVPDAGLARFVEADADTGAASEAGTFFQLSTHHPRTWPESTTTVSALQTRTVPWQFPTRPASCPNGKLERLK